MKAVNTKLCEPYGPFHDARTRLRIALPSIIGLSGSAVSNASVSGRSTGRRPYSFSRKTSSSSGRRTFSQVATSVTLSPAFVTMSAGTSRGSGFAACTLGSATGCAQAETASTAANIPAPMPCEDPVIRVFLAIWRIPFSAQFERRTLYTEIAAAATVRKSTRESQLCIVVEMLPISTCLNVSCLTRSQCLAVSMSPQVSCLGSLVFPLTSLRAWPATGGAGTGALT